jgi:V8-like Glu-specific endopeptidase
MNTRLILVLTLLAGSCASIRAGDAELAYAVGTGKYSNTGNVETNAFSRVVLYPGVHPMRLHFSEANLGERSYLRLTSVKDRQVQRLDARALRNWSSCSAMFNGDAVLMELVVAPGESGIFATMDKIVLPVLDDARFQTLPRTKPRDGVSKSLCGDDNRVASSDNRVGRINGCTAWLISNTAVLTAGHCTSGGTLSGVFEVNVPLSDANGTPNAAATNDQFPLNTSNLTWQDLEGDNAIGEDFCIFGLNANAIGEVAHLKFGFFRVTQAVPTDSGVVRVTGFGLDNTPDSGSSTCCQRDSGGTCIRTGCNSRNRTLQTSAGDFDALNSDGTYRYHDYDVDTEPANSGSPIIWEANGFTIGIHTTGGCSDFASNKGTAFAYGPLATAMDDWLGATVRYADAVSYPGVLVRDGNIFRPYQTLSEAYSLAPDGTTIQMVESTFPKSNAGNIATIGSGSTKTITFRASVGRVHIGD